MRAVPSLSPEAYRANLRHGSATVLAATPVDEPDLLALIADTQTPLGKPFADSFREACEADALSHDGYVHPSRVSVLLHADLGDFDPRRFSAMWAPACGRNGFLDKTDEWRPIDPEVSKGNGAKEVRLRRWRGWGAVVVAADQGRGAA